MNTRLTNGTILQQRQSSSNKHKRINKCTTVHAPRSTTRDPLSALLGLVVPLLNFGNVDFGERIIDEFFSEHDDGQLDAKIVETGA